MVQNNDKSIIGSYFSFSFGLKNLEDLPIFTSIYLIIKCYIKKKGHYLRRHICTPHTKFFLFLCHICITPIHFHTLWRVCPPSMQSNCFILLHWNSYMFDTIYNACMSCKSFIITIYIIESFCHWNSYKSY